MGNTRRLLPRIAFRNENWKHLWAIACELTLVTNRVQDSPALSTFHSKRTANFDEIREHKFETKFQENELDFREKQYPVSSVRESIRWPARGSFYELIIRETDELQNFPMVRIVWTLR